MKLSNKYYDVAKWLVMIVMPALVTLIGTIGTAVGWAHTELVMTIVTAITAFFGASLGFSSANYYKEDTKEDTVGK